MHNYQDILSPRSLAIIKAQPWKSLHQDLNTDVCIADAEMDKSLGTEDFKEGVAHFAERRAARFTGR